MKLYAHSHVKFINQRFTHIRFILIKLHTNNDKANSYSSEYLWVASVVHDIDQARRRPPVFLLTWSQFPTGDSAFDSKKTLLLLADVFIYQCEDQRSNAISQQITLLKKIRVCWSKREICKIPMDVGENGATLRCNVKRLTGGSISVCTAVTHGTL